MCCASVSCRTGEGSSNHSFGKRSHGWAAWRFDSGLPITNGMQCGAMLDAKLLLPASLVLFKVPGIGETLTADAMFRSMQAGNP